MAKLTLRRRPKSRGKTRGKTRGKIRGKTHGKIRGKSRILGHKRKSRIQRGGVVNCKDIYTDIMLELLDAWYTHPDLRTHYDKEIVAYIQTFFRGVMFQELIKLRSYYETKHRLRLSEIVCTKDALDIGFTSLKQDYPYPRLLDLNLLKWQDFVESLRRTINIMQQNDIDIAIVILKHDTELTSMESIAQLRRKINDMSIDKLSKHGLLKALERRVKWQNDQTTSYKRPYKRPGDSLSELHAEIENDKHHPPRLILNKPDIIAPNVITITPSFASNSATLYHTFESKRTIANFDVYKYADAEFKATLREINTEGGLRHAISFRYRPGDLSVGRHVFQLETFPQKKKSEELIITVRGTEAEAEERHEEDSDDPDAAAKSMEHMRQLISAVDEDETNAARTEENKQAELLTTRAKQLGWNVYGPWFENPYTKENIGYVPPTLPPVPHGWKALTDPSSGKIYYANTVTNNTQWEKPVSATAAPTATAAAPTVPTVPTATAAAAPTLEELQKKNELIGWSVRPQDDGSFIYYKGDKTANSLPEARLADLNLDDD